MAPKDLSHPDLDVFERLERVLTDGDCKTSDAIVVLQTTSGPANKVFETDIESGKVVKIAAANRSGYFARQIAVPDPQTMTKVLNIIGSDPQACLIVGRFESVPGSGPRVLASNDWKDWRPPKTKHGTETDPSAPILGPCEYRRRRHGSA